MTVLLKPEKYEEDCRTNALADTLHWVKDEPLEEHQYEDEMDPSIYSSLNAELGDELKEDDWTDYSVENTVPDDLSFERLPPKSRKKYTNAYIAFIDWFKQKNFQEITEDALVGYFVEKADASKSSTLWSLFSMIKATMIIRDHIDIGNFKRLLALIKQRSKDYVAKKPSVFTKEQLQRFLKEAPDQLYLMMKVALIIGVSGGLRRDELAQLTVDEVEDLGAALLVKIRDPKSNFHRSFTVFPGKNEEFDYLEIYRKYCSLRPKNLKHKRFFVSYRYGVCTSQVVGVNTFGKIAPTVARYLQLPNPESYTARSFRKSSLFFDKDR